MGEVDMDMDRDAVDALVARRIAESEEKSRRLRAIQAALGEIAYIDRREPESVRMASIYEAAAALSRLGLAVSVEGEALRVGDVLLRRLREDGGIEAVGPGGSARFEDIAWGRERMMRPARWASFVRATLRLMGEDE